MLRDGEKTSGVFLFCVVCEDQIFYVGKSDESIRLVKCEPEIFYKEYEPLGLLWSKGDITDSCASQMKSFVLQNVNQKKRSGVDTDWFDFQADHKQIVFTDDATAFYQENGQPLVNDEATSKKFYVVKFEAPNAPLNRRKLSPYCYYISAEFMPSALRSTYKEIVGARVYNSLVCRCTVPLRRIYHCENFNYDYQRSDQVYRENAFFQFELTRGGFVPFQLFITFSDNEYEYFRFFSFGKEFLSYAIAKNYSEIFDSLLRFVSIYYKKQAESIVHDLLRIFSKKN